MYANGPRIVTDGLLFNFDAANSKSITTGGSVWRDLSANRHVATLYNGAAFTSSELGYVGFDGSNDWARIDFATPITLSTYTHDHWVRMGGYAPGYRTVLDFGNDKNAIMTNNNTVLHYNPYAVSNYTISTTQSSWTNIVVSHEFGGPLYFYINGELVFTSSNTSTVHSNVGSAGIGGGITGPTTVDEAWAGGIAIVRFYLNKALTQREILQNYMATKGRYKL